MNLSLRAEDDPFTCAAYAMKNGLLDTPGCSSTNIPRLPKGSSEQLNYPGSGKIEDPSYISLDHKSPRTLKML